MGIGPKQPQNKRHTIPLGRLKGHVLGWHTRAYLVMDPLL